MLIIPLFCVALLAGSVWIIAETHPSRPLLRVSLGLLTIAATAVTAFCFARFTPEIEIHATRSSLRLAEQLLARGEIQCVQQGIYAYNELAGESTYEASFKLWSVLNKCPGATETEKVDAPPPPTP